MERNGQVTLYAVNLYASDSDKRINKINERESNLSWNSLILLLDRESRAGRKTQSWNNIHASARARALCVCVCVYATWLCVVWHTTRGPDDDRPPLLVVTLIQWYPISYPTHPPLSLIPPAIIIFINCRSGAYIYTYSLPFLYNIIRASDSSTWHCLRSSPDPSPLPSHPLHTALVHLPYPGLSVRSSRPYVPVLQICRLMRLYQGRSEAQTGHGLCGERVRGLWKGVTHT